MSTNPEKLDMFIGFVRDNISGDNEEIRTIRATSRTSARYHMEEYSPMEKGKHLVVRRHYPKSLVRSPNDIRRDRSNKGNVKAPQYGSK